MRHFSRCLVAVAILLAPALASAAVTNGDFELGATGWTADACPGWTFSFLAAGGNPNGFARIQSPFGNSAGTCCIQQTFVCGEAPFGSTCTVTFDFSLEIIDASPLTARIEVYIDGTLVFFSPVANNIPFTLGEAQVTCGQHTIRLCLHVDAGNNGWRAGFDNVVARCEGPVDAQPFRWQNVKALYE